jgi:ferrochelatase
LVGDSLARFPCGSDGRAAALTSPRARVLLLALGTPDAPDAPSVRRYLAEFLSDRRVIDLPRWRWLPILHGIVLRARPAKSAALYRAIWTPDGSPLAVISAAQAAALESRLRADGCDISVRVAMRYGSPSIASAMDDCARDGVTRVLALPMYPQYSGATTGSSLERLYRRAAAAAIVPTIHVVPPYFDDPRYIRAVAADIAPALVRLEADTLVLSFHGLPARYVAAGDPYASHCDATADAVRRALPDFRGDVRVTYQSRFGREAWLQPYTSDALAALGAERRRVVVACPGFTADCLETLEEIALGGRAIFERAGGEAFQCVPCLNASVSWIEAMRHLVSAGAAPALPFE